MQVVAETAVQTDVVVLVSLVSLVGPPIVCLNLVRLAVSPTPVGNPP